MPGSVFHTNEATRRRMQNVRLEDTPIERIVRKMLHSLGYRFRLHRTDLPGKPDIVLPKYKTVVFVHGCFWHGHDACIKGQRRPKRNAEVWAEKIKYNKAKDQRVVEVLMTFGWKVVVIWECQTKEEAKLRERLSHEIGSS